MMFALAIRFLEEQAGRQRVIWPAGLSHRLWTEGSEMETLMVERIIG
jgi:hypothetical protein